MTRSRRGAAPLPLALLLGSVAACYPPRLPPPPPAPRPVVEAAAGAETTTLVDGVVELALASIGSPYEWGGTDANGFDCSGLIQFAYGEHGIRLPRTSRAQIRAGAPVDPAGNQLRPGDVLGFSRHARGETSHVGLYVGEGRFIHSSSTGVRISEITDPYWDVRLVAARRIVQQ